MALVPLVIPARPATEYPEARVAALSVSQSCYGAPLVISYQLERYAEIDGVPVDAPVGTSVGGNFQIAFSLAMKDEALANAIRTINAVVITEAVRAGKIAVSP